ncbi:MAG: hypothetical protein ACK4NF_06830, partial [Planctomycetota bacterium]
IGLPYALPTTAKVFKLGKGNIWYDITNSIFDISSDRRTFKFSVENNTNFDRDADYFGSTDPGGFRFIVDPIGIFAPEMPSLPPDGGIPSSGGGGGGGGCFVNPKFYDKDNNINTRDSLLSLIVVVFIFSILSRFYKSKRSVNN